MLVDVTIDSLSDCGMSEPAAKELLAKVRALPSASPPSQTWTDISRKILTRDVPFLVHLLLYQSVFGGWNDAQGPPPAWTPARSDIDSANITALSRLVGVATYSDLYRWSCDNRAAFWERVVDTLGIRFATPPSSTVDLTAGVESPQWLPGAELNIAESCFQAPGGNPAVIYQPEGGTPSVMSYDELAALSNRVANSLAKLGLAKGDPIAIAMPMTVEAVASYLGIVKAGCVVVSIADSFSPEEIGTRLRIAKARTVITQDVILRAGKTIPMYQRVVDGGAEMALVIPAGEQMAVSLRDADRDWHAFLAEETSFEDVLCHPSDTINILFSSGTTGDPKAIPWTQTTPIKCTMDGYLHQDIKAGDVVAWPTNIGWMMGPWLIFASLINRGTIALYYGAPGTPEFCRFVLGCACLGLFRALSRPGATRTPWKVSIGLR
jgi:acetyl-CoA synthetase